MNTDSSNQNSTPNYHDDEIDLRDLILPLFQHKWLILAIAVACTMLGAIYHLGRYTFTSPEQYHLPIAFVFSGANEGEFPNGDKFSANDVIASQILRRVYDGNSNLSDAVSYTNFVEAISISYGFSAVNFLGNYINELIDSDRKITVDEFNQQVERYMQVLSQKSRSTATITLNNSDLRLPDIVIAKVLPNIAQTWSASAIEQRGVLSKFSTFSSRVIPVDIANQDSFFVINILDDLAKRVGKQLDILLLAEGARSFADPQNGISFSDLRTELDLLANYQIALLKNLMVNETVTYGSDNGELRSKLVQYRLQQLRSLESQLVARMSVYEESINQFDQLASNTDTTAGFGAMTSITPSEYTEDFVDTILDLGSKLADSGYRKQLIEERIRISLELEEVRTEIAAFSVSDTSISSSTQLQQDLQQELADIKSQLERIISNASSVIQAYNQSLNNNSAELYQSLGDVEKIEGYKLINSSIIKILAAAFVLGLFLGVIVVFVRKMLAAPRLS